jgi:hypothetical protein
LDPQRFQESADPAVRRIDRRQRNSRHGRGEGERPSTAS